jgi:hypothetical protein
LVFFSIFSKASNHKNWSVLIPPLYEKHPILPYIYIWVILFQQTELRIQWKSYCFIMVFKKNWCRCKRYIYIRFDLLSLLGNGYGCCIFDNVVSLLFYLCFINHAKLSSGVGRHSSRLGHDRFIFTWIIDFILLFTVFLRFFQKFWSK